MRDKRTLQLDDDRRKLALGSIRRRFKDELDQDVCDPEASLLLEFSSAELGPAVDNMGVADAKAFLAERTECSRPSVWRTSRPGRQARGARV
jgi:uncharacterized protein (DUF2164 family)